MNQHPFVLECHLEQRGCGSRRDDLTCLFERLRDMPVVVRDRMSAGEAPARHLSDFVPGVEDRLQGFVGCARKISGVGVVPEPQVALRPGDMARL